MSKLTKRSNISVSKIAKKNLELSDLLDFSIEKTNILDNILYNLSNLDSLININLNPVSLLSSEKFDFETDSEKLTLKKYSNIIKTEISKKQKIQIQSEIRYLELEEIITNLQLFYNNSLNLNPTQRLFLAKKLKNLLLDVLD